MPAAPNPADEWRVDQGEIVARHYATGQPTRLRWRDGIIADLAVVSGVPDPGWWLAPQLVDLQINGFAGVDFQQDNLTASDLARAVAGLRQAGCGRFLLTLMTDDWGRMISRLANLRARREERPELAPALAGWHLEGPFLSAEPGYCGAHDPERMMNPSPEHIHELRRVAGADPVLLTLAPEREGALEAIALAVSLGITVSLGHTNAGSEILRQAAAAGASGFTHLGNACPQELDRHDNIVWRVLDGPSLTISLIPDQRHVSPPLFRLVHRLLPGRAIYYTTDAVAAAGAPPGRYRVGRLEVAVGPDQVVRQPGQTNYAGSGLRPVDGVFLAARMLDRGWQETWDFLSVHPARFMGWRCGLEAGGPADFCLVRLTEPGAPAELRLFIAGRECGACGE